MKRMATAVGKQTGDWQTHVARCGTPATAKYMSPLYGRDIPPAHLLIPPPSRIIPAHVCNRRRKSD
ncbi:MAG: hypothetical protein HND44_18315 [Chloroflexi bacterium]|nr:hypothetical protein [Ardenticatenaceae bacterium]NOG36503.1 hypothetical protein [Chloroflexota bacterium]